MLTRPCTVAHVVRAGIAVIRAWCVGSFGVGLADAGLAGIWIIANRGAAGATGRPIALLRVQASRPLGVADVVRASVAVISTSRVGDAHARAGTARTGEGAGVPFREPHALWATGLNASLRTALLRSWNTFAATGAVRAEVGALNTTHPLAGGTSLGDFA